MAWSCRTSLNDEGFCMKLGPNCWLRSHFYEMRLLSETKVGDPQSPFLLGVELEGERGGSIPGFGLGIVFLTSVLWSCMASENDEDFSMK